MIPGLTAHATVNALPGVLVTPHAPLDAKRLRATGIEAASQVHQRWKPWNSSPRRWEGLRSRSARHWPVSRTGSTEGVRMHDSVAGTYCRTAPTIAE
jgi:hypothetical protein